MTERLTVDTPGPLLSFLRSRLDGWGANTLKDRLRRGCIRVNNDPVTRHDHPLEAGDLVEVGGRETGTAPVRARPTVTTIHADDDLIAINKPAGLLSVSTDRERGRTALALVRDSVSPSGRPGRTRDRRSIGRGGAAKLWPVHRLDRETSGVLLFARSKDALDALRAGWAKSQKTYLAIVEGHPTPPEGEIDRPLWEDRSLKVHVGQRPGARDACTRYRTRERGNGRTLLEVELITGRRHQIRAHLAWLGHAVVGDRRYGSPGPHMGLHAHELRVAHPTGGSPLVLTAPPPRAFSALLHGDR